MVGGGDGGGSGQWWGCYGGLVVYGVGVVLV